MFSMGPNEIVLIVRDVQAADCASQGIVAVRGTLPPTGGGTLGARALRLPRSARSTGNGCGLGHMIPHLLALRAVKPLYSATRQNLLLATIDLSRMRSIG